MQPLRRKQLLIASDYEENTIMERENKGKVIMATEDKDWHCISAFERHIWMGSNKLEESPTSGKWEKKKNW